MSYDPKRERVGTHSPSPEKYQSPPYYGRGYGAPRPAANRAPAQSQSSFFDNASNFNINDGEFSNIAGDKNETVNNDHSMKSNFNNDYKGSTNYNGRALHNDFKNSTNSHYNERRGMPVRGRRRQHYPQERPAQRNPAFYGDGYWEGYDDQDEMDDEDLDGSYYDQFPANHGPAYGQTARDRERYFSSQPWQKQGPTGSRTRGGPLSLPAPEPMSEQEQMISKLLQFMDSHKDAASLLNAFFTNEISSGKKEFSSDSLDES